jgi:hypothetical protein
MIYFIQIILFIILILIIANIIIISVQSHFKTNIKCGGSSHVLKYSIIGMGDNIESFLGLEYSILHKLLKKYNFEQSKNSEWVNLSIGIPNNKLKKNPTAYNPKFYEQQTAIKNVLDKHSCFLNKSELYKTIKKLIPIGIQFLPKSYTPEEFENSFLKKEFNTPYILKKDRSNQQLGVKIIKTKEEYFKEKKALQIVNNAIISEYINNPLTIEGKKFHLRIHFLISVISGITRCYTNDFYHILTAKLPYKNDDWLNDDIHLTGGNTTMQRYEYPDDLTKCDGVQNEEDIETIIKNVNECVHVINMALSMSNVKNYSESDAGYQIYGADVLITKNFHAYIIEINSTPGYGANGFGVRNDKKKEDEFKIKISENMFLFELNNVIFPYFGLSRPNISPWQSEFIGDGVLSPFGTILTGNNKCFLIPYNTRINCATESEIDKAKKMNFYSSISFSKLLELCDDGDIFLISISLSSLSFEKRKETKKNLFNKEAKKNLFNEETKKNLFNGNDVLGKAFFKHPFEKRADPKKVADVYGNDNDNNVLGKAFFKRLIIGFIGVDRDSFIKVAIIEEYQNRGIATAMIAQLLEIYAARYNSNHVLKIRQDNVFLNAIAKKLHFDKNHGRHCKINNPIYKKINSNKVITYKIIKNDQKSNFDIENNSLFAHSDSQFVHFLYEILTKNKIFRKHSTGNKHDKNFTYQGAELKSSLKLGILKNIPIFTKYIYTQINHELKNIFNSIIDYKNCEKDKIYKILNMEDYKYINSTCKEEFNNDNYIIKEDHLSFLSEDKNIFRLRYFFIIYVSNSIIKFFQFSEILAISYFDTKIDDIDIIINGSKYIKYNFPEDFKNSDIAEYDITNPILVNYINLIINTISKAEIITYKESNSGFLPFTIDINFIKIGSKFVPNLHNIWNNNPIEKNDIMDDHFIKKYYQWIENCVIYPHFGCHHEIIKPILCINKNKTFIDINIIYNMSLQFNNNRDYVDVFYMNKKIETIKLTLHELYYAIELNINDVNMEDNLLLHCLFILMDILAAYYAPHNIQLIIEDCKKNHNIAYQLDFYKSNIFENKKEYFIRKCRM